MLREDNLGLGAKIGGGNAETFGLSMFSGLLGRLNGKDDAVLQQQQDARRDVELRMYQAGKYGTMNFVSGGLLVGDKMEPPKSTKIEDIKPQAVALKETNRKRKAGEEASGEIEAAKKRSKSEKKTAKADGGGKTEKQEKKRKSKADASSSSESSDEDKAVTRRNKADKKSRSERSDDDKARAKEEKRARKEERRKRKEERRRRRAEKEAGSCKSSTAPTSAVASDSEALSGVSTPTFMGGRQAVRHRYIMQKRMAAGNAQALKEIFMLKPQTAS